MITLRTNAMKMPRVQRREVDCRLRLSTKPPTEHGPLLRLVDRLWSTGEDVTTYYLCAECGIVVGCTPQIRMHDGTVVECANCGAWNQL